MPDTIVIGRRDHVLTVTLNRPDRLNAMTAVMRAELADLWRETKTDTTVRCVVVTGAGRAFSAGVDAQDLADGVTAPTDQGYFAAVDYLPAKWLDIPVVVAINGLCVGMALHWLADADIAIASHDSWFCDPHVSFGQVSSLEPLLLSLKCGIPAVTKLALLGAQYRMSAAEALRLSLVSEVVAADELLGRADQLATVIAGQSPAGVRRTMQILRRHSLETFGTALLDFAWDQQVENRSHPDATEGALALFEKRDPKWA